MSRQGLGGSLQVLAGRASLRQIFLLLVGCDGCRRSKKYLAGHFGSQQVTAGISGLVGSGQVAAGLNGSKHVSGGLADLGGCQWVLTVGLGRSRQVWGGLTRS